jgi:predicted RNase H-like nuclease
MAARAAGRLLRRTSILPASRSGRSHQLPIYSQTETLRVSLQSTCPSVYPITPAPSAERQNVLFDRALVNANRASFPFHHDQRCMLVSIQASRTSENDTSVPAKSARATSAECRAVAKQGFHIFPKIVEIDLLLQRRRELVRRVFEVHPEVAFCQMNGSKPVSEPKKIKGKAWQPGIMLRALLLAKAGIPPHVIDMPLPKLVGRDDWVDALAALVVARRLGRGEAVSSPSPPEVGWKFRSRFGPDRGCRPGEYGRPSRFATPLSRRKASHKPRARRLCHSAAPTSG